MKTKNKCKRCGKTWMSNRNKKPKLCRWCKSSSWDRPKPLERKELIDFLMKMEVSK